MLAIDDIRFFLVLVNSGSLAAAARAMNVTPSAVTQRLQALEARTGVRLLERSTRGLNLTDEGELLRDQGAAIRDQTDLLFERLSARQEIVSGNLRIHAPPGFGRRHVAPLAARFQANHPDVRIALALLEDIGTGDARGADITFHIGPLEDSSLVGYRMAPNRRILCAAPGYLKRAGMPAEPADLSGHQCLVLDENREDASMWKFTRGGRRQGVRVAAALTCNDGEVIHEWALEGRGIMIRSEWDVAQNLRLGKLVEIMPAWQLPAADVIALVPQRRGMSARVKKFIDLASGHFAPAPPWRT
jgi:DNA-binding transcriptional LysR family regulator